MKLVYGFMLAAFALSASTSVLADTTCSGQHSDGDLYQCSLQQKKVAEDYLNKEYMAAKTRINQAYFSHKQLSDQYIATFIDTQRGWLKYRDGQCKLEAFDADDDSNAHAVAINLCITRIDKERTAILEKMPY